MIIMNEEYKEDINKAVLDYIEENKLLETNDFTGLKVFEIFNLTDIIKEWVDDYDAPWSGGRDGNEPMPQKIEEHLMYDVKRSYQFQINGLSHSIEVEAGTIEKKSEIENKKIDIDSPNIIIKNLRKDVYKNRNLIPFLCILFNLNVIDVKKWTKENEITKKYHTLKNIQNSTIKKINSISESINSLEPILSNINSTIEDIENSTSNTIDNNNLIEAENINNNILTYIEASHKLLNSGKITISDYYYNEIFNDSYYPSENDKQYDLLPEEVYTYEHDRNYTFKVSGMDYKIKINMGKENFSFKLEKTMKVYDDEKKLLSCIHEDIEKEPNIIPLLVAIFNIDVNKLRNKELIELYNKKNKLEFKIKNLVDEKTKLNISLNEIIEELNELEYQLGGNAIDNSSSSFKK